MKNIFFKLVKWENDHLEIYFPKHKSNQIGLNKDEARHVYSNLNNPSDFLSRALVSHLLVFPSIFVDGKKLFPGKDSRKRFNTCLHMVIKSNKALYKAINI